MTQRRVLIYSYVSCAALAVGSLGPWVYGPLRSSGSLSYSGISGSGILTLFGAGLAALAIRRTASRRWSMLVAAQIAALLCAAVAIYSIYDIYDFYSDAGETWVVRVGWGLILTLVAAIALNVLCVLQYRRSRSGEGRSFSWRKKLGLLAGVAAALALGFWAVSSVVSDDPTFEPSWFANEPGRSIPNYALNAASGGSDGAEWSVWLFGEDGDNCWATKTGRHFPLEEAYCDYGVPPRYWQLIAEGPIGEPSQNKSILVFLTRDDVGRLEVLTGSERKRGRRPSWSRVQVQVIDARQARKAHLHGTVGYAAAVVQGISCVRQIAIFDPMGKQIRRTPLWPCEHHEAESPLES
jgi:hypothetical protein